MILPIAFKLNQNFKNSMKLNQKQKPDVVLNNTTKLSGANNPMKSYISFGWCTAHYQAMYEIDKLQTDKLSNHLLVLEEMKLDLENRETKQKERYSIYDKASLEAGKIISQYSNLMFTVAEVPPSFALQNAKSFRKAIEKSETLSNPLTILTTINNIAKMDVKNDDLTPIRKERAKGATQLYSIAILLERLEEKKNQPEFKHILSEINSLSDTLKETIKNIYGDDIFDKIAYYASLDEHPSDEDKRGALNFIIEVDSHAESLKLPSDFEKKLSELLDIQSDFEGRTAENSFVNQKPLNIKLNYPNHDHNPVNHEHHHDDIYNHEYMHTHGIKHTH